MRADSRHTHVRHDPRPALLQAYAASADERVRKFGQWLSAGHPGCSVRCPTVDWSNLTFGQHLRQLEVEGYTVFPRILPAALVGQLKAAAARAIEDTPVDYSTHQRAKNDIEFAKSAVP